MTNAGPGTVLVDMSCAKTRSGTASAVALVSERELTGLCGSVDRHREHVIVTL
jgi:hypothetical protein